MSSFSMSSFLLVFWIDESQSNMLDLPWFLKPSCLLDRRVWSWFLQKNFKVHTPLIYFVCLLLHLFSILASFLFWGINYPTYNQFSKKLSYFVWNRLYNWHLLMTYFFNYKKNLTFWVRLLILFLYFTIYIYPCQYKSSYSSWYHPFLICSETVQISPFLSYNFSLSHRYSCFYTFLLLRLEQALPIPRSLPMKAKVPF